MTLLRQHVVIQPMIQECDAPRGQGVFPSPWGRWSGGWSSKLPGLTGRGGALRGDSSLPILSVLLLEETRLFELSAILLRPRYGVDKLGVWHKPRSLAGVLLHHREDCLLVVGGVRVHHPGADPHDPLRLKAGVGLNVIGGLDPRNVPGGWEVEAHLDPEVHLLGHAHQVADDPGERELHPEDPVAGGVLPHKAKVLDILAERPLLRRLDRHVGPEAVPGLVDWHVQRDPVASIPRVLLVALLHVKDNLQHRVVRHPIPPLVALRALQVPERAHHTVEVDDRHLLAIDVQRGGCRIHLLLALVYHRPLEGEEFAHA
mmetsp:Transcript_3456/g.8886  ORF Transcript_3456/g.8886 Transcript_3456/m.8886 type:complete len:316 (-) Transcript_3456:394-1341(-)